MKTAPAIVLFISVLLLARSAPAQRIIYDVPATLSRTTSDSIIDVRPDVLYTATHKLVIIKRDKSKEHVNYGKDKIWGYEDGRHQIYRLYKNDFYLVKNIEGPVYLYFTQSGKYGSKTKEYLFSATLSADVYVFNKKNLLKAFKNDSCLQKKISMLKEKSSVIYTGETSVGKAEIINRLYKECH